MRGSSPSGSRTSATRCASCRRLRPLGLLTRHSQGKPWSVRAGQLLAAAANAHLVIVDADIQFTHFELSAHSLMRTLLDPLQGLMPQSADAPAEEQSSAGTVAAPPASMVSLNAPRSYLSDDGIVHLFSALLMHASLGTHVHQPMGGEFSLHARFNTALLSETEGGMLPQVVYDDAYCVQAQLLTRALMGDHGPVVERLMRGKWHAKIGLAKILHAPAHGKSRIDLVTERMFDDIMALSAARCTGALGDVELIAAGRTFRLSKDGGSNAFVAWVRRSRQLEGTHVEAAAGTTASPRRYAVGRPQGSVYPDPLAQQMCVLAPPISRKEIWAALKANLREFFTRDLASLPERCSFADEVLPLLHCACNAPRGAFRVADAKGTTHGSEPAAAVFGPEAWARATISLLIAYRAAPPGSDARRAVVHANRLSWLLGALAFLNSTVAGDWGAAHEHLDIYRVAFRTAYLRDFLSAAV